MPPPNKRQKLAKAQRKASKGTNFETLQKVGNNSLIVRSPSPVAKNPKIVSLFDIYEDNNDSTDEDKARCLSSILTWNKDKVLSRGVYTGQSRVAKYHREKKAQEGKESKKISDFFSVSAPNKNEVDESKEAEKEKSSNELSILEAYNMLTSYVTPVKSAKTFIGVHKYL